MRIVTAAGDVWETRPGTRTKLPFVRDRDGILVEEPCFYAHRNGAAMASSITRHGAVHHARRLWKEELIWRRAQQCGS